MEFLSEYGLFLAKSLTVVIAILVVAVSLVALGQRGQRAQAGHIEINKLNDRYRDFGDVMQHALLNDKDFKKLHKADKKKRKEEEKGSGEQEDARLRLFVMQFDGDIRATATDNLREEISAVLVLRAAVMRYCSSWRAAAGWYTATAWRQAS